MNQHIGTFLLGVWCGVLLMLVILTFRKSVMDEVTVSEFLNEPANYEVFIKVDGTDTTFVVKRANE